MATDISKYKKATTTPTINLEKYKKKPEAGIPITPTKEPGFFEREITGQTQEPGKGIVGFGKGLLQTTLGSKGLLGVAQLPGKVIGQPGLLKERKGLSENLSNLADLTVKAIKLKRTLTDPARIAKYDKMIANNLRTLKEGGMSVDELQKLVTTPEQAVATTLRGTATAAGFAGLPTVGGRVVAGGLMGAAYGMAEPIEKEQEIKEVAIGTGIGAVVGVAAAGLLEGISAGVRSLSQSKYIQKRTGYTYGKELQPPIKEVTRDIEKGFKTFGEQVADVVDDTGKPVYYGRYPTLRQQGINQIKEKGEKLGTALKTFDETKNPIISREDIAGNIIKEMEDVYGKLKPSQIKQVEFEVSRMPEKMNLQEVLKIKRMFDNLIPETFWSKLDDPAVSFPSLIKYTLRDNARQTINTVTNNPVIQELNNAMSLAMDVRSLASKQIAQRATTKISGVQGGYFFKLMGRLIDDWIFNPAITTRTSQAIRRAGTTVGQTIPRQIGRTGLISGIPKIISPD